MNNEKKYKAIAELCSDDWKGDEELFVERVNQILTGDRLCV